MVSEIVANWGLDCDSIVAALLHDVVEDTEFTLDDINAKFGEKCILGRWTNKA